LIDSPLTELRDSRLDEAGLQCFVKRDELLANRPDSPLCGNKYRKLYYHLERVKQERLDTLVTFGGAYSNHLAAVAEAAHWLGIKAIGIVRGEEVQPLNYTLQNARKAGMKLVFTDRTHYRALTRGEEEVFGIIDARPEDTCVLPEGGTHALALRGCAHLMTNIATDYVTVACGTGGTLAGMITALPEPMTALGFSVLKGDFMTEAVRQWLPGHHRGTWHINNDYHFGGYGKWQPELLHFMRDFRQRHQISLDPIYTGKMCYGVFDLIRKGYFARGSTITIVHTGGLQGIPGFEQRFNLTL